LVAQQNCLHHNFVANYTRIDCRSGLHRCRRFESCQPMSQDNGCISAGRARNLANPFVDSFLKKFRLPVGVHMDRVVRSPSA
jgi:hypothetical protein